MDPTLREALRKYRALRTQLDNMLLGDNGDEVEAELKKFVAKLPCWMAKQISAPSLNELITLGKYDWVDENITDVNFPIPEGFAFGLEPKLYHFNRYISSRNVIKEMEKDGFRPATIWDLLDYGAKNPELQRQFPIVALGSVEQMDSLRRVAYFSRRGVARILVLSWFEDDWPGQFRFLAVRN